MLDTGFKTKDKSLKTKVGGYKHFDFLPFVFYLTQKKIKTDCTD
jgi:hypothetical protein